MPIIWPVRQIRWFPYVSRSVFERQQQLINAVKRQRNLGLESDNLWCRGKLLISIKHAMNSSRIELLWLVWDQSQSKYYLRTKFLDGIDKPQKCRNVCYHPTHQQQSDFIILVLYDFIVQNILSSLLLLCYNLMIRQKKKICVFTVTRPTLFFSRRP